MQQPIIQFQFSNENGHTNLIQHWFEKLRHKTTELGDKPKQLIVARKNNILEHWKIIYNPKTRQFEKLELLTTSSKVALDTTRLLFDDQKNELVFPRNYDIRACDDTPYPNERIVWYIDKQTNKRYLIVGRKFDVLFRDWETKQITISVGCRWNNALYVNEETQELLLASGSMTIEVLCLKTFMLKKPILTNDGIRSNVCFVNESKTLFAVCTLERHIQIWNKETRRCAQTRKLYGNGSYNFLIYSAGLNLLISPSTPGFIECWKLKNETGVNPIFDMSHDLKVKNPFGEKALLDAHFLDEKQTRLFVCNVDGSFYIIDLVAGHAVWQMESSNDNHPYHVLLQ